MAYAIALTLNSTLANKVRQLWQEFEMAGIGKTPGQFAETPHITLSLHSDCNRETLIKLIDSISVTDLGARLVPFGAFLGKAHILYFNAVLSGELLQAHVRLYDIFGRQKIGHDPLFSPGNVIFHCTIAVEIEDARFLDGINICLKHREILEGTAESIELIEFFPVNVIHRRLL